MPSTYIPSGPDWCLEVTGFSKKEAGHRQTKLTLGNGYHGLRGVLEFARHIGNPGSFFAGVFDLTPVHVEELVSGPDWADLQVRTDGVRFDPLTAKLHEFRRTLDMKQGLLFTTVSWTDCKGHRTTYDSCRLVHSVHKQRALLWGRVTPENWSGELVLAGGIDVDVENTTQTRHVKVRHIEIEKLGVDDEGVVFSGATVRTRVPLAMRTRLETDTRARRSTEYDRNLVREVLRVKARERRPISFVKWIACQGLPVAKASAPAVVRRELRAAARAGLEKTVCSHVNGWRRRWRDADVVIEGHLEDQVAVRFNIFHLMQAGPDMPGMDVSIAAKALHGEGYRGHVFWDTEIFMLPFFLATDPEVARSLLMYRYNRLPAAREHAAEIACRGARYPWESAVSGHDTTPGWPSDIVASLCTPHSSHKQHHVTSDIALGVSWYRHLTGDEKWYLDFGARIVIETALFWSTRVKLDKRKKRYMIRDVQCPDEFHNHVDNNAYTNYCAAEKLRLGLEAVADLKARRPKALKKIRREIGLTDADLKRWKTIQARMYIPFDEKTGMFEQFDGYFKLTDAKVIFDEEGWPMTPKKYRRRHHETQIIKQADVVLLTYLFGHRFSDEVKHANFMYYEARDVQGSSLSPNTYAIVGIEVGEHERAYRSFRVSAYRDIRFTGDTQGIHAACLGGTWQAVVNGFGGMRTFGDVPSFRPWLPPQWKRIAFKVLWRGTRLAVDISRRCLRARALKGKPVTVRVFDQDVRVSRKAVTISL